MKISIITVCYNSASVIRTALESVLRQTFPEVEYLVVDGGSTDGTVEILREYEKKFISSLVRDCVSENADACAGQQTRQSENKARRQFIWVSEPDKGMYDAINKGIRWATGDVVGILNADDVLADDRVLERVAGLLRPLSGRNGEGKKGSRDENAQHPSEEEGENAERGTRNAEWRNVKEDDGSGAFTLEFASTGWTQKVDVVYGDIRFVANRLGAGLDELRAERTVRYYSARFWRPWMLQWGFMPPHPSVYIRRECFERLGEYALDYKIAADYALLVRFLRKARLRCRYLPLCMVDMRVGGMSTKNWRSNLLLNQEIVRGNRDAGYFCCLPMLLPKYFFKAWEFLGPRVQRVFTATTQWSRRRV